MKVYDGLTLMALPPDTYVRVVSCSPRCARCLLSFVMGTGITENPTIVRLFNADGANTNYAHHSHFDPTHPTCWECGTPLKRLD